MGHQPTLSSCQTSAHLRLPFLYLADCFLKQRLFTAKKSDRYNFYLVSTGRPCKGKARPCRSHGRGLDQTGLAAPHPCNLTLHSASPSVEWTHRMKRGEN